MKMRGTKRRRLTVSGFEHGSSPFVRVVYGWFDVALKKCTNYSFKNCASLFQW